MDCSARDTSCTPTWENTKNAEMEKMYLQAGKNEDSLELELGASASRVHHNLQSDGSANKQSGMNSFGVRLNTRLSFNFQSENNKYNIYKSLFNKKRGKKVIICCFCGLQ